MGSGSFVFPAPFFAPNRKTMASPATLSIQAEALVAAGSAADAYRLLTGGLATKDPDALFTLALWRLSGAIIPRDLSLSRNLFGQAAGFGHPQATQIHANFLANGTGGPPDWPGAMELLERMARVDPAAVEQLDLIGRMALDPAGAPHAFPPATLLSDQPDIRCIHGLFSASECAYLIRLAEPWLQPAVVIDPRTGRQMPNSVRTSDSASFPFIEENPAIHALNRRIASATDTEVAAGEPLQVLRYRDGQEYRPHLDAVASDANQRVLTALIYLNEGYSGGETQFLRTGLRFKGCVGDALIFWNVLADGRPDELTQHAGLPVTSGEKLLASRWIRARPFVLTPPIPILAV